MKLHLSGMALVLNVALGHSQTGTEARPEFEVASIKPQAAELSASRPKLSCSDGSFSSSGVPLKYVIEWSYDIRNEFSVPNWAGPSGNTDNIYAKAAGPVSLAQCRLMTQRLLEERFKLKLHRETKEMSVYMLVVGKEGSKMREVKTDGPLGDGVWLRGRLASAKGWEPWMIAATLATIPDVGRPVLDKTGLKGVFEFRLNYAAASNEDGPDIFRAIQDQLGLKLLSTKGPVEFVVLDRLEKPTEN